MHSCCFSTSSATSSSAASPGGLLNNNQEAEAEEGNEIVAAVNQNVLLCNIYPRGLRRSQGKRWSEVLTTTGMNVYQIQLLRKKEVVEEGSSTIESGKGRAKK